MHRFALIVICLGVASTTALADTTDAPTPVQPGAAPAPLPAAAPPHDVAPAALAPKSADNLVFVELAGNAGFYSVNFEHMLNPDMGVRVGASYMSVTATASSGPNMSSASATIAAAPVMFDYLGIRSGAHALELGAGIDLMYFGAGASISGSGSAMASGFTPVGTATIGYRYASPDGGMVFRAGYTPLIFVTGDNKQVFHWGGISAGYRF